MSSTKINVEVRPRPKYVLKPEARAKKLEYLKQWRRSNKPHIITYRMTYYKANSKHINQKGNEWKRKTNYKLTEKSKITKHAYYLRNKDRIRAYQNEYKRLRNKDKPPKPPRQPKIYKDSEGNIISQIRFYYLRHKAKILAYNKAHRQKYVDKRRLYGKHNTSKLNLHYANSLENDIVMTKTIEI